MSVTQRFLVGLVLALSGLVVSAEVARASCSDGIQNGTETGVDCGGACLKCLNATCASNGECQSGSCVDSKCAVVFSVAASQGTTPAQPGFTVAIDPALTIAGSGNLTGARVLIASGFQSSQDVLAFTNQSGISGSWSSATGVLTLTGTATVAQYEAALRTVTYRNTNTTTPNTADRIITFSLGENGLALEQTGHFYEYVGGTMYWETARDAANNRRYYGLRGYLVTVTSAAENAFVASKLQGQGWMGANDNVSERIWRWVTGPEGLESGGAGRHFFTQTSGGVGGSPTLELNAQGQQKACSTGAQCDSGVCLSNLCYHYDNWNGAPTARSEPNNCCGSENFGHFLLNPAGFWNDYYPHTPSIQGYVVEYGGMPDDPPVVLQSNKTVRIISVSCNNGIKDGTETDIDCGGSCGPCTAGKVCGGNADCTSGVCVDNICQNPTCTDGVRNGSETDLDCGGSCTADCGVGLGCNANGDCQSGKCTLNVCQAATCTDSVKNQNETDVDCGGVCGPCANGNSCLVGANCVSGICNNNICQSAACTDGVKNGTETAVDCGGGTCSACTSGLACTVANDCQSRVCTGLICQAPSCGDGVRNGDETGPDCGGSCAADCAPGAGCGSGADCTTGVCTNSVCQAATCFDGVKNGSETGIDCGGASCADCGVGQGCGFPGDCLSGSCVLGVCAAPTCSDGVKNGTETDLDCGGAQCAGLCETNEVCAVAADCSSLRCVGLRCAAATCSDGVQNQGEAAVDCGGPCALCGNGTACVGGAMCASGYCSLAGFCATPTCSDGELNQGEVDVDCAGPCAKCANGSDCVADGDCVSLVCDGICVAASCTDEVQNASETGVDCGGPDCDVCGYGGGCVGADDCVTGYCDVGVGLCGCPEGEAIGTDGRTCIGVGECDGLMTCEESDDLVFYGVVSQGGMAVGSIRCERSGVNRTVVCDTDPETGKLAVSPVLWCEP